jgi:hypothetical protein
MPARSTVETDEYIFPTILRLCEANVLLGLKDLAVPVAISRLH